MEQSADFPRNRFVWHELCPGERFYADPRFNDLLRELSPAQKWALSAELTDLCRNLIRQRLCERNPSATEEDLHRMLAEVLLGRELADKVYGMIPEDNRRSWQLVERPDLEWRLAPDG